MPSTEEDIADMIVLTSSTEENDSRVRIMVVHTATMIVALALRVAPRLPQDPLEEAQAQDTLHSRSGSLVERHVCHP